MKKLLLFITLFYAGILSAQTRVYFKNNNLQIGEQTELVYEFLIQSGSEAVKFEPFSKMIPCEKRLANSNLSSHNAELEIIGEFKDTILKQKAFKLWRGIYKITVWDTGQIIVPTTTISLNDSIFTFGQAYLNVSMPKTEEGKDIYDIKESFVEVETDYISLIKSYWWILALIIGLIVAFYLYKKRKKNVAFENIKELNLKERTLLALEGLEKANLWNKDQMKEHYIELSFIFRSYLASRYELNLLEKTSYETALLLAKKELSKDTIQTIKTILDYADLVKFAKAKPTEFDVLKNMAQVRQIVAETSPLEIEHAQ